MKLNGKSQADQVRSIFEEHGGSDSIRRLAERCIESGVFDEDQIAGFSIQGAIKVVKDALTQKDEDGLRFAYNTTKQNGENAIWKRQLLLDFDDCCFVIQEHVENLTAVHAEAVAFRRRMALRFGGLPEIPELK